MTPIQLAPTDWWLEFAPCEEGCTLEGAAPPHRDRVWCSREDGRVHGQSTTWWGSMRVDERYQNGLLHGWQAYWSNTGQLLSAKYYEAGQENGPCRLVAPEGVVDGTYARGVRTGVWTSRGNDGVLLCRRVMKNGKHHGLWESWHANGALMQRGDYFEDKRHDLWTDWHSNGTKLREGAYNYGVPDGVHRVWDSAGTLLDQQVFSDGMGRWTFWYATGIKKTEGYYKSGKKHGRWREWSTQGELLGDYELIEGSGEEIEWSDAGQMIRRTTLRDGIAHGLESEWAHDGQLVSEVEYAHGALVLTKQYDSGALTQCTEWRDARPVRTIQYEDAEQISVWDSLVDRERHTDYEHGEIVRIRETRPGYEAEYKYRSGELSGSSHDWGRTGVTFEFELERQISIRLRHGFRDSAHREVELRLSRFEQSITAVTAVALHAETREGAYSYDELEVEAELNLDAAIAIGIDDQATDRDTARLRFAVNAAITTLAEHGINLITRP